MAQVLIVSELKLLRSGLGKLLLEAEPPHTVSEASDGEEALRKIEAQRPHVVLLHIGHPVGNGMRTLHLLRERAPDIPVLTLLDTVDDEVVMLAMHAGAAGCLDKGVSAETLLQALSDAAAGEVTLSERLASRIARIIAASGGDRHQQVYPDHLTRREIEILSFLACGLTNKEIARGLFISESTVRAHLRAISQKLRAHNRVHAVARAVEMGVIPAAGNMIEGVPFPSAQPGAQTRSTLAPVRRSGQGI